MLATTLQEFADKVFRKAHDDWLESITRPTRM